MQLLRPILLATCLLLGVACASEDAEPGVAVLGERREKEKGR